MQPPQKILVARGGAIGDFILTLPVFTAIRSKFPKAYLATLTGQATGALAQHGHAVDDAQDLDASAWAGFFAEGAELDLSACDWLASFDCIISFLHDPDGVWQRNAGKVTEANFYCGESKPGAFPHAHASQTLLNALKPLGIIDSDPVARLQWPNPPKPSSVVTVHPGSGSAAKNWPEAKWIQLINEMLSGGIAVRVVGGETEIDRLQHIRDRFKAEEITIIQNQPLETVAQSMASCAAFIGHDSGITHLASALGLNCIVLWSESNQTVWRPLSKGVEIISNQDGIEFIEPEQVKNILQKFLPIH